MSFNLNTQSFFAIVRQVAAIASIVIGCLSSVSLPPSVHTVLVAFGALILSIEHYVADPSTGSTPTVEAAKQVLATVATNKTGA
jgi:hypothetical protein